MPEMTGIDFLRTYQKDKQEAMLPVLMLSSVENSSEKLKCFHFGARDYVVKPFNPEELLVRIKNLLPR
jgi:DNA-binding response OmpR family regulator